MGRNLQCRRNPALAFAACLHRADWKRWSHDPRILWPDTLSLASNGYLSFTANQLDRHALSQWEGPASEAIRPVSHENRWQDLMPTVTPAGEFRL